MVTNKDSIRGKLALLKGQGLAKDREYWHEIIGYNYRLSNVACAIGLVQLEKINDTINKKRQIAFWYKELLENNNDIIFHEEIGSVYRSYWMCSILLPNNLSRDLIRRNLFKMGIETRPTFYLVHMMPMYKEKDEHYEVAEDISCRGMNLPSWPGLKKKDISFIVGNIIKNL